MMHCLIVTTGFGLNCFFLTPTQLLLKVRVFSLLEIQLGINFYQISAQRQILLLQLFELL